MLPGDGQWNSLADQGVAGAEEANPSTGVLSELIALVGNGLVLAPGETFSLGAAYNVAGLPDLSFEFFMTSEPLAGDFNADGTVDGADLAVWSAGYGDAYSGNDLLVWQRNLGETNPAGIPKILRGVVRYESIVATAATIPEPGSVAMALIFVLARAASSTWPKTRRRPEVVC